MKLRLLSFFFVICMLFSLAACAKKKDDTEIRIYTLNGTTGFGMAKLMDDAANGKTSGKYTIDVKTDVSEVQTALTSGDVDIAALPTNAASVLYHKTQGKVRILAINTLGCLYLLNTGNEKITSISQLAGQKIYVPAQNPTFILTYLCQENGLRVITTGEPKGNEVLIDSTSYAQPANLRDAVASGTVSIAVLPEPMVTIAVSKGKSASPAVSINVDLDLTAEWDKLPGKANTLVQGCLVVRAEFLEQHPQAVTDFMKEYKSSIEYLNSNPEESSAMIATYKIFENANVAKLAIPKCNVRYIAGEDMKVAVGTYLEILDSVNSVSIGGKIPTDDFYYIEK